MRLLSLLVAAVIALAPPREEWRSILPGLELAYPRDHGAHFDTSIEWWYLTGQLEAEDGARYGLQFTVFRRGLDPEPAAPSSGSLRARHVLAAHFALTDIAAKRTHFAERLRRVGSPLAGASTTDLDVFVEDWSLRRGDDDRLTLVARDKAKGIALELELVADEPLVRHGQGGYSPKGRDPGNASAYVSWPRMAVRGTAEVGGRALAVEGEAWFDHEFGSSVLEPGVLGWDWFGLQLDDGRELMLFDLRREDGTLAAASAGTLVEADGSTRALGVDDFQIEPSGRWTSPRTGAVYPAGWRLTIPDADVDLTVTTLVSDCELQAASTADVTYWEGPVEVSGSASGRGYAELTGYAGSMTGRF